MEIMDGFSRYDNIRNIAYDLRSELDRKNCFYDEELASEAYDKFLNARRDNMTIADAAMRESLTKNPLKYPDLFKKNLAKLQANAANKYDENYFKKCYPKTLKARTMLIENDRVTLSSQVLPKAKGLEKALLKLKLFFKI